MNQAQMNQMLLEKTSTINTQKAMNMKKTLNTIQALI